MAAGKIALVTGSNKGIGKEIVRLLCRLPDLTVILTSRDVAAGHKAAEDIAADPEVKRKPDVQQLDISIAESVDRLKTYVSSTYGGLDILCNNAGFAFKMADSTPFATQAEVTIGINYTGTLRMMEAFWPIMRSGGRIINVSSTSGGFSKLGPRLKTQFTTEDLSVNDLDKLMAKFVSDVKVGVHENEGWPNTAYGVSKTGVTALTKVFARRAIADGRGLTVACCCPGWCRTDMAGDRASKSAAEGADTPYWLCTEKQIQIQIQGTFFRERQELDPSNF